MRTYHAFFNRKKIEIKAESTYAAQLIAAEKFKLKPSQGHKIAIVLADVPVNVNSLPGA